MTNQDAKALWEATEQADETFYEAIRQANVAFWKRDG